MKSYRFIILAALVVACAGLPVPSLAQNTEADAWKAYQQQFQNESALKKEAWEKYQKEQDVEAQRKAASWAKWDEQQNKETEHQARFETLLIKWEEQAKRYDRILDAMEKQYGVEKVQEDVHPSATPLAPPAATEP